jgi:hypothetical protein
MLVSALGILVAWMEREEWAWVSVTDKSISQPWFPHLQSGEDDSCPATVWGGCEHTEN